MFNVPVFLEVKHDVSGVFRLASLTSYREFIGYIVGSEGAVIVQLKLEDYLCGNIHITVFPYSACL